MRKAGRLRNFTQQLGNADVGHQQVEIAIKPIRFWWREGSQRGHMELLATKGDTRNAILAQRPGEPLQPPLEKLAPLRQIRVRIIRGFQGGDR